MPHPKNKQNVEETFWKTWNMSQSTWLSLQAKLVGCQTSLNQRLVTSNSCLQDLLVWQHAQGSVSSLTHVVFQGYFLLPELTWWIHQWWMSTMMQPRGKTHQAMYSKLYESAKDFWDTLLNHQFGDGSYILPSCYTFQADGGFFFDV